MSQQQLAAQLDTISAQPGVIVNLSDLGNPPVGVSAWTPGASNTTLLNIQPPLGEVWAIVGWQLTATGYIGSAPPAYGMLGRLIAGPSLNATPVKPAGGNGLILPADTSNLDVVWDGSTDPPFAQDVTVAGPGTGTLITASRQLASPIQMSAGDRLGFGIYLTRSLTADTVIQIRNGTFIIIADDGKAPSGTWGGS